MLRFVFLLVLWVAAPVLAARGQMAEENLSLYYVTERLATVFVRPDSSRPYVTVKFREPVHVLDREGRWYQVRTKDGAQGYVYGSAVSNVWVRVSKHEQTIYVYRGTEIVRQVPADLGYNAFADKEKRGSNTERDHWRTPDGTFFVVRKNPRSQFYKAFVLNYPTAEDAERGLRNGIISRGEYEAIVKAEVESEMPPMGTALGGYIEIHGHGTGARSNWTQGCIAVKDAHMDDLWNLVSLGTPVLVEP